MANPAFLHSDDTRADAVDERRGYGGDTRRTWGLATHGSPANARAGLRKGGSSVQRLMQALKWPGFTSSRGGTTSAHSFVAIGQRVRNTQPDGGLMGLGMSPWRMTRSRFTVGSGIGTAESSASVYGWTGLAYSSLEGAISMMRPRYMTMT